MYIYIRAHTPAIYKYIYMGVCAGTGAGIIYLYSIPEI